MISNAHTKRVGISLRVENIAKYKEKRDVLSQDWIIFLEKQNLLPILIPNTLADVNRFLSEMQIGSIILSGGDNIGDDPERDKTEKQIIEFAIKFRIPVLGVCRGMQVLNDYFGGSLVATNDGSHVGKPHRVEFIDPKFSSFFGNKSLEVNSFHNNIIKHNMLGTDLKPLAVSKKDQTVEACFHQNLPIIGVMWHPERDQNIKNESILMEIFQKKSIWNE